MNRQDYDVLIELSDEVAKLGQRSGRKTGRGVISSSVIKRQIASFARKCQRGELKGQDRKRKADKLFMKVMRSIG